MPGIDARSDAVVRVRVRTTRDVYAARDRARAALGRADLHPPTLPPSAILCVRRAQVPCAIGAPLDIVNRRRFDSALRMALNDMARRAARPADGFAGGCDAVVFDDFSELLACLARDWSAGRAADRWWWRALLRERITLDLVVRTWANAAPQIAPAFERLATWRAASWFVSTLDQRHVQALAAAILRAHGGPRAEALLADRPPEPSAVAASESRVEICAIASAVAANSSFSADDPSSTTLRRDQRALLAVVAVVRHRVSLLRHVRFVEAFRVALRAIESGEDAATALVSVAPSAAPQHLARQRDDVLRPSVVIDPPTERLGPSDGRLAPTDSRSTSPADIATSASSPVVIRPAPFGSPHVDSPSPSLAASDVASQWIRPFTDTPLGGIFYLLNVAITLRLYGDFTMPQRRGLPFPPWDFLALVAEHWLGEPLDAATANLLARLAGRRPEERPGVRFIPDGRLMRWLPRIVRRINAHVARALGESAGTNVSQRLLCHQARIYATAAHIDVTFVLASLPIDIRLGGLDRDPGWIPAGSRIVRFHYL